MARFWIQIGSDFLALAVSKYNEFGFTILVRNYSQYMLTRQQTIPVHVKPAAASAAHVNPAAASAAHVNPAAASAAHVNPAAASCAATC